MAECSVIDDTSTTHTQTHTHINTYTYTELGKEREQRQQMITTSVFSSGHSREATHMNSQWL